jgi:Flp pilus assembly protein TadD
MTLKRYEEAIACQQRAVAIDPDYAEAECALGSALHAMQRHAEALPHFHNALAVDADFVEARFSLGSALQALGRHAEAVSCYEAVVAVDATNAAAWSLLGVALQAVDRDVEALRCHEHAIALEPSSERFTRLGRALQEAGRIDEAHQAYELAIALDATNANAYLALLSSKQIAADDACLASAEALARDIETLGPDDQVKLHFALGKAYATLNEPQRSFECITAGNVLRRRGLAYEEAPKLDAMARMASIMSRDFIRAFAGAGDPSARPIFILGMPRSGSTLIEQILASHPKVMGGGERSDFGEAVSAIGLDSPSRPFPDSIATMRRENFRRLGSLYLERIARLVPPERAAAIERVTDKLPGNFALVGLIHLALPNARIIHTRRDPIETCLSCFATHFANVPYSCDLGELGRYYAAYARLMNHWRDVLPPDATLEVSYEDVVAALEPQARRLLAYCGLDWDDACLAFHNSDRPVRTASMSQVRQPIYRSAIQRWRPSDEVLRPLLVGLGDVTR